MIECSVQNISKSFGANKIFENISFEVKSGERIGLIGPNGVGKTTILRILMGKEDCDGTVSFRKRLVLGYLEQIPVFDDNATGAMVLNLAFKNIYDMQYKMEKLEHDMSDVNSSDDIMQEYSTLQLEYELAGGYDVEEKVSKVIKGLNIDDNMLISRFNILSGGEKTKIMLGRILLEAPELLLLDEPSNHLDVASIQWLEQYISAYKGCVVIVSHDRYFLDKSINKIIEISSTSASVYYGNYTYFVQEKRRRYEEEFNRYKQNQKDINRVEEQIKRYRIWGAMRDSDKMYKQAKILERRLEKMDKLDRPVLEAKKMKLKGHHAKRTGKETMIVDSISKSFGEKNLFNNISLKIFYQDAIGLLGDNGSGKSTMLKIMNNELVPDSGSVKHGSNLNIGYLEQNVIFTDENKSILEYFQYRYNLPNSDARRELAKVLFLGDDVFKKISVLSGGEKSRLRLCMLMYENVNFMMLDEPTNHLDIESRELFEALLKEFDGTIIFVSHDRYFISKIGKKIVEIHDKNLIQYDGDYEYYKSQKEKQDEQNRENQVTKNIKTKKNNTKSKMNLSKIRVSKLRNELHLIEDRISIFEKDIDCIDEQMHLNGDDSQLLSKLHDEKIELQEKLDAIMIVWENTTDELEAISNLTQ